MAGKFHLPVESWSFAAVVSSSFHSQIKYHIHSSKPAIVLTLSCFPGLVDLFYYDYFNRRQLRQTNGSITVHSKEKTRYVRVDRGDASILDRRQERVPDAMLRQENDRRPQNHLRSDFVTGPARSNRKSFNDVNLITE